MKNFDAVEHSVTNSYPFRKTRRAFSYTCCWKAAKSHPFKWKMYVNKHIRECIFYVSQLHYEWLAFRSKFFKVLRRKESSLR